MKRFLPLLVTFLFITTVSITGWFYVTNKSQNNNDIQIKPQNTSAISFTLIKESGEILYKQTDTENFKSMTTDEVKLPSGSTIKTTVGQAHVLFADNSLMSIDNDTEIVVNANTSGISINQILGKTWHRVQTLLTGQTYIVETPTAIASVRGTMFGIDVAELVNDSETDTTVTEGAVNIEQFIKNGKTKDIKFFKLVTAGKYLKIKKYVEDQKLELKDIPEIKKSSKFFIKNERIKKLNNAEDIKDIIRNLKNDEQKNTEESTQTNTGNLDDILRKIPQLEEMTAKLKTSNLSQEEMQKIGQNACQIIENETFKSKLDYLKVLGNERYQQLLSEYNRAITECSRARSLNQIR